MSYCGGRFYSIYGSYEALTPTVSGGIILVNFYKFASRWGNPGGADLGGYAIKYGIVLSEDKDSYITVNVSVGEQMNRLAIIGLS